MAEGWTRQLKGDVIEPYSAGITARGLNRRAVQVMTEVGIDISHHTSKEIGSVMNILFDYVITVCSNAGGYCPAFPGKTRIIHIGFDDPPSLAKSAQSEEDALSHFRCVRGKIRDFIETLPPGQFTKVNPLHLSLG